MESMEVAGQGVPVLLGILDGEQPRKWRPWGDENFDLERFDDSLKRFEPTLAKKYKGEPHFVVRLTFDSPEALLARGDDGLTRVVGVLIDTLGDGERLRQVQAWFDELCVRLRARCSGPLYRQVGFYIVLCGQSPLTRAQVEIRQRLYDQAVVELGLEEWSVHVDIVCDGGYLLDVCRQKTWRMHSLLRYHDKIIRR